MARIVERPQAERRGRRSTRRRSVWLVVLVVALASAVLAEVPAAARPSASVDRAAPAQAQLLAANDDYGQPPRLATTLGDALGNFQDQEYVDMHDSFAETYEMQDHQQASEQTPGFSNGRSLQFIAQAEINAPDQTAKLLVFQSRAGESDAEGIINGQSTNPHSEEVKRIELEAPLLPKTETHPGGLSWLPAPKNTQGGYLFMSNEYVNGSITALYFDQSGSAFKKVDGSIPVCAGAIQPTCMGMTHVNDVSVFVKDGTYYLFAFDLNVASSKNHWEAWSAPASEFLDLSAFPPSAGLVDAPATAMDLSKLTKVASGRFTGGGVKPSGIDCDSQQHTVLQDSTNAWYLMSLGSAGATCSVGAGTAYVWTNKVTFPADGCPDAVCVDDEHVANQQQVGGATSDYYYPSAYGAANLGVTSGKRLFVTTGAQYAYAGAGGYYTRLRMYVQRKPIVPNAPTNASAIGGQGKATVTWTAPTSNGYASIDSYRITPYLSGVAQTAQTFASTATTQAVAGLTPGGSYAFKVQAHNVAGYGLASSLTNAVVPTNPPPSNDLFVTPYVLSGATVNRPSDSNLYATKDAGEPSHNWNVGGASVWYQWTAGTADPVSITTAGSSFNTELAVYTGSAVNALTWVASNDDAASGTTTSRVDFTPTPGAVYRIVVDGAGAYTSVARGTVAVHLTVQPPTVPGPPTDVTAAAGDGEAVVGWLAPSSSGGRAITGYVVTPTNAGVAQAPITFASTDTNQVVTGLQNGSSYTFKVATVNAVGTGPASAATSPVTPAASVLPPFNDDFVDAPAIPTDAGTFVANNTAATREAGEPRPFGVDSDASTWASFQRSSFGKLTIDTCGTGFDTVMGVYTGTSVDHLTLVADNDEGGCGDGPSRLVIAVTPGTTYLIDVAGYDPDGSGGPEPAYHGYINFSWLFQTAPEAVDVASATGGFGTATVSWAPGGDGRSPITGYVVTPFLGAVAQAPVIFNNDTSTTHEIPIADDGKTYTFTVKAKNAIGTGPASPSTNAVVVAHRFAPFASWTALVTRLYVDLTAKAPTASELSSWVAQLQGGTKTVGELAAALRRGTENTTNVDPAARLYRAFLGRTPDATGLKFWVGRRRTGAWTLTRTADYFAGSSEFIRKYGSLSNKAFVTLIYTDVLGRAADPSGVTFWTSQLDTKRRSRGSVMVGFSESSEFQRKQLENTDAAVGYIMLLGRAPTAAEVAGWSSAEKADPTLHDDLLTYLLHSDGYQTHITG